MPSGSDCALGVDLGGTRLRACLVDERSRVLVALADHPHQGRLTEDLQTLGRLAVERAAHVGRRLASVGLALPGTIAPDGRRLTSAPTLPAALGLDLVAPLEHATGLDVLVENDANAAAWAEWETSFPTARCMLLVRLGTGVGGAVIVNGRILRGANGMGGEIGHVVCGGENRPCGCGGFDCVETYAGGAALAAEYARRTGRSAASHDIGDLLDLGDVDAVATIEIAASALGRACATLVNLFDPDALIVDGRPWAALSRRRDVFERTLERHSMRQSRGRVVHRATLGDNAGAIGAARLSARSAA